MMCVTSSSEQAAVINWSSLSQWSGPDPFYLGSAAWYSAQKLVWWSLTFSWNSISAWLPVDCQKNCCFPRNTVVFMVLTSRICTRKDQTIISQQPTSRVPIKLGSCPLVTQGKSCPIQMLEQNMVEFNIAHSHLHLHNSLTLLGFKLSTWMEISSEQLGPHPSKPPPLGFQLTRM